METTSTSVTETPAPATEAPVAAVEVAAPAVEPTPVAAPAAQDFESQLAAIQAEAREAAKRAEEARAALEAARAKAEQAKAAKSEQDVNALLEEVRRYRDEAARENAAKLADLRWQAVRDMGLRQVDGRPVLSREALLAIVPQVDPRTPEGKQALSEWRDREAALFGSRTPTYAEQVEAARAQVADSKSEHPVYGGAYKRRAMERYFADLERRANNGPIH